MCGRYVIISTPEAIRALFGYGEQPNFPPRYNVAPTQPIPIVRLLDGKRSFALMRWGLLPSWVKDPKTFPLLINARGESVLEKPAFRNAMRRRRCLLPADGFYEWKKEGASKTPMFIQLKDGRPFAFAGLWEVWQPPDGGVLKTCTIITTPAQGVLAEIHDRMPLMLPSGAWARWLDPAITDPADLLVPWDEARGAHLELRPVATTVAYFEASFGSTSGSGFAIAKTIASFAIPAMSSPPRRPAADTPMNTSEPTIASRPSSNRTHAFPLPS